MNDRRWSQVTDPDDLLTITAYWAAGRATVAIMLGWGIGEAVLFPERCRPGLPQGLNRGECAVYPPATLAALSPARDWQELLVGLASDQAMRLATGAHRVGGNEQEVLDALLAAVSPDQDQTPAVLAQARREVTILLTAARPVVEAIARQLVATHRLSAGEITALCQPISYLWQGA